MARQAMFSGQPGMEGLRRASAQSGSESRPRAKDPGSTRHGDAARGSAIGAAAQRVYLAATPLRAGGGGTPGESVGSSGGGGPSGACRPLGASGKAALTRRLRRQQGSEATAEPPAKAVEPPPPGEATDTSGPDRGGNLIAHLEAGGHARRAAMDDVIEGARSLAFQPLGCRAVQQVLQVADQNEMKRIVGTLRGCVQKAIFSPHGNYVIQKVVETAPSEVSSFVAEELVGSGAAVARHRYGCRIFCRLLEHAASNEQVQALVDEVLAEAAELSRQVFGHFVIEAVLEHGLPPQRSAVAAALLPGLPRSARNRSASHVVEKALEFCREEDRKALAEILLVGMGEDSLTVLAGSHFGTHVVRALARLPGYREAVSQQLLQAMPDLLTSKNARRLLADLHLVTQSPRTQEPF